mmetsp:Transcript_2128/g.3051  ORF Transcript_2128/g.3051 Transcript_2128/m.3051 type:complete len:260 (+) Transcript_2128:100-879(+)
MNCKEHHLPELELATGQVREALQAILHTILFIRSPGPVAPQDVHCEGFDMTYTRIANDSTTTSNNNNGIPTPIIPSISASVLSEHNGHYFLDKKVDDSIETFLKSLKQIGPELLSGCLTLSFFERRASKQLFGLVSHEEKVIWEQWILYVVVNNTPRPVDDDKASIMERQRIQDTAEAMLRSVFMKLYDCASGANDYLGQHSGGGGGNGPGSTSTGSGLDHIPPSMYEFEIRCSKRADDREDVISRVRKMPALLNLDGS